MPGLQTTRFNPDLEEALQRSTNDEYSGGFAVPPVARSVVQQASVESVFAGGGTEEDTACSICMCDFNAGDHLRTLQCLHRFHVSCVDRWLAESGKWLVCQKLVDEGQTS